MTQPQPVSFTVMADEHLANAIVQQLNQKGVHALRLIDHLPAGTPDPDVLAFCHQHRYALLTLDEPMRGHVQDRLDQGLEHAGVFIGTNKLQGTEGIGTIVNFVVFYHKAIMAGAATLANDVYNEIIQID